MKNYSSFSYVNELDEVIFEDITKADFVIKPEHNNLHWSAFDKTEKFIDSGELAANNSIKNLINQLDKKLQRPKKKVQETFWTKLKKRLF